MTSYLIVAGIVVLTALGDYFLKTASGMERGESPGSLPWPVLAG